VHVLREQVAALSPMLEVKWSKTIPSEPGFYWWREGANGTPAIIQLSRRRSGAHLRVEVIGSERVTELLPLSTWAQGEWAGPIKSEGIQ
jgi:hypothetical protein